MFFLRVDEAIEEYLIECQIRNYSGNTIKAKKIVLDYFDRFINGEFEFEKINKIKAVHIKQFIIHQQKKNVKSSTINTKIKILKSFFRYLDEEGYLKENPMLKIKLLKEEKAKFTVFSDIDIKKMLRAWKGNSYTSLKNNAILSLMIDSGIRCSELRNLKFNNVSNDGVKVRGKGNKWRVIPISPKCRKQLLKYERARNKVLTKKNTTLEFYFFNQYQEYIQDNSTIQKMIKLTAIRANVKANVRASPHTLRHYYAIKSLELGTSIHQLSKNLGHESIKTTEIYLSQITNEQLERQAMEKSKSPLSNL